MSRSIEDRFWSKVDIQGEDACWLWQASKGAHGYGQYRYQGTIDKAHRVAWMISTGETVPEGRWVLHSCDNRLCVNPRHLRLGTADDNVSESVNKERASHSHVDEYDPEGLRTPLRYTIEPGPYNERAAKWEGKADFVLRNGNTICLGGYGLKMYVQDGSLMVKCLSSEDIDAIQMNRGLHKIRHIIIYTHGGFLTLDAIEWLVQQSITLYLLNYNGELLQVLSPRQNHNARLAYLQYKAYESDLALNIARELVYYKARQQVQVLTELAGHPYVDLETVGNELSSIKDVETLRMYEARYAAGYWQMIAGTPIKWRRGDLKHIPEHWYAVSTRMSDISKYNNASQATNPFHSTLNFAYAILKGQILEAINITGLAPEVGYLHTTEDERAHSLVYDLQECFRPVIDSMILDLFRRTTFHQGDFIQWYSGECRLNDELKRYVIASCRIDDRAIDIQVTWLKNLLESQLTN